MLSSAGNVIAISNVDLRCELDKMTPRLNSSTAKRRHRLYPNIHGKLYYYVVWSSTKRFQDFLHNSRFNEIMREAEKKKPSNPEEPYYFNPQESRGPEKPYVLSTNKSLEIELSITYTNNQAPEVK